MHIAALERTLKSGDYACDICSHSGVARILCRASGVSVKDYTTGFNDSASDCDSLDC